MSVPELSAAGEDYGRALCLPAERRALPLAALSADETGCVRQAGLGWEERTLAALGGGQAPAPDAKGTCGLCEPTLESGCRQFGEPYCGILDRYRTDPAYSADDALLQLAVAAPAAQREAIAADLRARGILPGGPAT